MWLLHVFFFFFKQKTAYEMRISDWSSDVCSSDLGAVKGVGRGACEAIADERAANGPFDDLLDFCRRVGSSKLNRRTLEALVNAGALDALGSNRATLMLQLPEVLKATEQMAREREAGQVSLFGGFAEPASPGRLELPETGDRKST